MREPAHAKAFISHANAPSERSFVGTDTPSPESDNMTFRRWTMKVICWEFIIDTIARLLKSETSMATGASLNRVRSILTIA